MKKHHTLIENIEMPEKIICLAQMSKTQQMSDAPVLMEKD